MLERTLLRGEGEVGGEVEVRWWLGSGVGSVEGRPGGRPTWCLFFFQVEVGKEKLGVSHEIRRVGMKGKKKKKKGGVREFD